VRFDHEQLPADTRGEGARSGRLRTGREQLVAKRKAEELVDAFGGRDDRTIARRQIKPRVRQQGRSSRGCPGFRVGDVFAWGCACVKSHLIWAATKLHVPLKAPNCGFASDVGRAPPVCAEGHAARMRSLCFQL